MRYYGKIETLFWRDEDFNLLVGALRRPEVGLIKHWVVTEKIDGMNTHVRLEVDEQGEGQVTYGGRTVRTQMPPTLLQHLHETYPLERMRPLWKGDGAGSMTLFMEGYGARIQKGGGLYRPDQSTILFDVLVNDKYWMSDDNITRIAEELSVPRVPILGPAMSLHRIIYLVKGGFHSRISKETRPAEGIVARTRLPLYDQRGRRLIIKLKTKDFGGK